MISPQTLKALLLLCEREGIILSLSGTSDIRAHALISVENILDEMEIGDVDAQTFDALVSTVIRAFDNADTAGAVCDYCFTDPCVCADNEEIEESATVWQHNGEAWSPFATVSLAGAREFARNALVPVMLTDADGTVIGTNALARELGQ